MKTTLEIETWIRRYIGDLTGKPIEGVQCEASFDKLGLDSATAVALVGDLEDWLGMDIDPTLPYDFPTIRQLASEISLRTP